MTLLPNLKAALEAAAEERRLRRHRRRRAAIAGLALCSTTAVAVAATTTPWRPQVGAEDRGRVGVVAGEAPLGLMRRLGVLRRSQLPSDRGADVSRVLARLAGSEVQDVRLQALRRLDRRSDGSTILVPVDRVGAGQAARLCLLYEAGPGVAQRCEDVEAVRDGRLFGTMNRGDGRTSIYGVVLDGNPSVTVSLSDGSSIPVEVVGNFFDAPVATDLARGAKVTPRASRG